MVVDWLQVGIYGKFPGQGDFYQRDLPMAFIRPWDKWLSEGLFSSREAIGADWAQVYLLSPPWRFAIEPGVLGPSGWLGVVVASIDRVNRFFPLTIAIPFPAARMGVSLATELRPALLAMESAAFALIDGVRGVDEVMAEAAPALETALTPLRRMTGRRFTWSGVGGEGQGWVRVSEASAPLLAPGLEESIDRRNGGNSWWWHEYWEPHPATSVMCRGLPPARGFAAFLDGRWAAHGWTDEALWI
jgi:type VI secretion system protein ImpM